MPENAQIVFQSSSLPEGQCFSNDQLRFNAFAAALRGYLPGAYNSFVIGNTAPAVEDQERPWIRLTADGFLDRMYYFSDGLWLAPHPIPASSLVRVLWAGTTSELQTYDGGEAGAISATTGPFWEVSTAFSGRVPLGVGTLPISGTPIAVNTTGGLEKVVLAESELPSHTHPGGIGLLGDNNNDDSSPPAASNGTAVAGNYQYPTSGATGGGLAHENMPPYVGIYFIRRSARRYYRAF